MSELVKVDESTLKAKIVEIEAKVDALVSQQMPDDIKLKLKDVLTWLIANL